MMFLFLYCSHNYSVMNNCDFIIPLSYFNKNLEQIRLSFKVAWFVIHLKKFLSGWADKLWEEEKGK